MLRRKPALSLLSLKCNNPFLLLRCEWQDQNIKALIILLHRKEFGLSTNENDMRLPTTFPRYHCIAGREGVGSYSLYNYLQRLECNEGCSFLYFSTLEHPVSMIRNNSSHASLLKLVSGVFLSQTELRRPPERGSLIILLTCFINTEAAGPVCKYSCSWSRLRKCCRLTDLQVFIQVERSLVLIVSRAL